MSESGEPAARQAAAGERRGGGESGAMDRRESSGFTNSKADADAANAGTLTAGGRANATEVIAGRSGFWQQDMVQADRPVISWPQSMWFSGGAGDCW